MSLYYFYYYYSSVFGDEVKDSLLCQGPGNAVSSLSLGVGRPIGSVARVPCSNVVKSKALESGRPGFKSCLVAAGGVNSAR